MIKPYIEYWADWGISGLRCGRMADRASRASVFSRSMKIAKRGGFSLAAASWFCLMSIAVAHAGDRPLSGSEFQDCPVCPVMVVVPAGSFNMGSAEDELGRASDEGPQHSVAIERPFAVGKYEITFEEWDACVAAGGCPKARDFGFGRERRPVIDVSWDDAHSYAVWLSAKTGRHYRLLTEAEWEYAARAGTATRYYFGNYVGDNKANCDGCGSQWDNKQTSQAGSFQPNAFGLYDMMGNVWEWVEDNYHENYKEAPRDGSAWMGGDARILRGGAWNGKPQNTRPAKRLRSAPDFRDNDDGFRIARDVQ